MLLPEFEGATKIEIVLLKSRKCYQKSKKRCTDVIKTTDVEKSIYFFFPFFFKKVLFLFLAFDEDNDVSLNISYSKIYEKMFMIEVKQSIQFKYIDIGIIINNIYSLCLKIPILTPKISLLCHYNSYLQVSTVFSL